MKPRLTIAIPTLNRADLVGRAIESALAQTSTEIEILVSDNGSSDETPAVIQRYAGRGLRTFRHDATMNSSRHGQFLIQQARGEFFLGLSDDDYLEPEFASEVLSLLDRRPDLAFVYTGCAVHYEEQKVPAAVGPAIESGLEFLAAHYSGRREVCWCACVTRVADLRELGPQPDDRMLGDMFYWTKLAFRGPVGCISRVLSHYILLRTHNDNMSHGASPLAWAREAQVLVQEVLHGAEKASGSAEYQATLRSNGRSHIARSTANQFVWTRLRGATPVRALSWLPSCVRFLAANPLAWVRVLAALMLPRAVLRYLLLRGAAKLAHSRSVEAPVDVRQGQTRPVCT